MIVRAGTSGFSYAEWKGSFYPEDLSTDQMLDYYGERFGTVEINNTYYRMPKAGVLEGWAAQVSEGFRFVLKANRRITHFKKLKGSATDDMEYFWSQAKTLGEMMGPVLVQLPGNFHKNADRIAGFLDAIPDGMRPAFEFRHESWWDDEVYDTLRDHNAALVIAQTEEYTTPLVPTADWGYLRLRKTEYEDGEVAEWADRVKDQDWNETYVFFKHEEAGTGPELAGRFMEVVA
ncbi:MAG: DUF72 domain-containing protein [Longimicrobiales bacterium]|nr:DUF72 domain-containing protein [Longimicrobiales bacterium]